MRCFGGGFFFGVGCAGGTAGAASAGTSTGGCATGAGGGGGGSTIGSTVGFGSAAAGAAGMLDGAEPRVVITAITTPTATAAIAMPAHTPTRAGCSLRDSPNELPIVDVLASPAIVGAVAKSGVLVTGSWPSAASHA